MRFWIEKDRARDQWRARCRLDNGTNGPSKRFPTRAEAKDWVREQETSLAAGTWVDDRNGRLTLNEWLPTYWQMRVDLATSSVILYKSHVHCHISPAFGDRPLRAITQPEIQMWVARLRRTLKNASVRSVYLCFVNILQSAVDAGLLVRSPCHKIKLPAQDDTERRFLPLSDISRLAEAMVPRYRPLVLLAGTAGLRMGELGGLTWERVDLFTGHVTVSEQLLTPNGRPEMSPLKTKASRRRVPIPRFVVDALKEYKLVYEPGPSGNVFSSWQGYYLRAYQFRRRYWAPAVEQVGLEGITPHALRHSAISLWIASGANPKQVQVWAGHSSIQITYDLYGHLFPEDDKRAAEGLDSAYQNLSAESALIIQLRRKH